MGDTTTTIRRVIVLGAALLMALGTLSGLASAAPTDRGAERAAERGEGQPIGPGEVSTPAPAVAAAHARAGVAAAAARNYWGAIAIANRDYAWGVSYDWPRKIGARKRAMRHCRRASNFPGSCKLNMFVVNQCGAYAWKRKPNGQLRWGWGRARLQAPAIRMARKRAGGPKGTKLLTWVCTTRP